MHAATFLHKNIAQFCPDMHVRRTAAIADAVLALLRSQTLALTAIGRHIGGDVADKHNIKRVDRLLGNVALGGERQHIYAGLAQKLIGNRKHPVILVDYSDVDAQRTRHILRAAIAAEGRAISVYEDVHTIENCPQAIARFLSRLSRVLPANCQPILVTDAGFRGTWRKRIVEHGWFYVMRQRNRELMRRSGQTGWVPCKSLYALARRQEQCHGEIEIVRNDPARTVAYTYAGAPKGRTKRTVHGAQVRNSHDQKVAAQHREPWLLLSNLPVTSKTAKKVVRIYKARMQIEETFRDLKSHRFGYAFRGNRTWAASRLEVLLLLAALASWLQWLLGMHACENKLDHGMQANTQRKRKVLSTPSVGRIFFRRYAFPNSAEMKQANSALKMALVTFV